MNTDHPDWENEAANSTDWEKKIGECTAKIQSSHCLDVRSLKTGTKLLVTFCEGDPVEFTLLDPATCKVLVTDGCVFREPTEGTLLGTWENGAITSSNLSHYNRVFLPGQMKQTGSLKYEVRGREFHGDGVGGILIFLPSGKTYHLWSD
jgi:hypothetical protein